MAKKCANCVLCEYNTNVEGYVHGKGSVSSLNDRQQRALEVISCATQRQLTGKPMGAYCLGDHPHFRCRSERNTSGDIIINFQTRQKSSDTCRMCSYLNERIRLEGDDGSSP
jgi:hypothetical protein